MQITSTKINTLKANNTTGQAKTEAAKAEQAEVATVSKSLEQEAPIDKSDIKIGGEGYDGKEVEIKQSAPFSHKLVAGIGALGAVAVVGRAAMEVASAPDVTSKVIAGAAALGAGVAGWAAADLASGFFHHFIDNYPKKPDLAKPGELTWDTPIIGDMASEFQVHHHFTRDLEQVPLVSNLYTSGRVLGPAMIAAAVLAPGTGAFGAAAAVFGGAMAGGLFLTQASHRWTHEPEPPMIAKALQKVGMAQSKEDHFVHHRMPWSDNYCIVNGMWNPVLTKNDFWRKWEGAIHKVTGAEPNSWRDPGVKELALGEITKEEFLERRGADKKVFKQTVKDAGERDALKFKLHGREDLTKNHAPD